MVLTQVSTSRWRGRIFCSRHTWFEGKEVATHWQLNNGIVSILFSTVIYKHTLLFMFHFSNINICM